ncbi:putative Holliday junction resolvase YggF [Marinobacterium lacunae]|uniref:Putative pre-16S rRNA nuclease n=1 Tax=Marinobacterium lacunae TaxID=1232683 RepID=A0A081G326_9GAMM|nr:Holliday junction resolvase RuvX [Marinobacterium lacunae]KEA65181.1 putative Holliday junction resolvase YggF [Marinobacterium lacunae]MBR9885638.1 Holliday junction resolvase RuvX [Oceanospirillales bacterium]
MSSDNQQVMGFDFGTTRIGVAIGQSLTGTAAPLDPLRAQEGKPDWDRLDALIQEWQPDALVVGLPLNMDGSISEMARRSRKFANRIQDRYQRPCFLIDERLTTAEAKRIHLDAGGGTNFKQESVDGIAARLLLEDWFASDTRIPSHTRLEDLYAIGNP